MNDMKVGDKVKVIRTPDSFYNRVLWWPDSGMTGTVEAIFKNGSIRVACDQLRNKSEDGKISKTFKKDEMRYEAI
ncbi:hypothetical protein [Bordetella phage vB_BbrM_PHB04]|uniref:Uncharacterized protein n=1 Tax=Bordetella phage vB_BbrM_PHB04 TaxID=2029657 RepID=A0A291L9Z8_9CAUD|nr:hypothetical protein HOS14_gp083 [Bordetella phage vB_BbrM_PHB04]ATI15701.1 hypothetical protein [Bordetella phage vB_BbrM_PHB04]